jgi:hypothetical protein
MQMSDYLINFKVTNTFNCTLCKKIQILIIKFIFSSFMIVLIITSNHFFYLFLLHFPILLRSSFSLPSSFFSLLIYNCCWPTALMPAAKTRYSSHYQREHILSIITLIPSFISSAISPPFFFHACERSPKGMPNMQACCCCCRPSASQSVSQSQVHLLHDKISYKL